MLKPSATRQLYDLELRHRQWFLGDFRLIERLRELFREKDILFLDPRLKSRVNDVFCTGFGGLIARGEECGHHPHRKP
jgi:hypothetical protein